MTAETINSTIAVAGPRQIWVGAQYVEVGGCGRVMVVAHPLRPSNGVPTLVRGQRPMDPRNPWCPVEP